jgi:ATP-binding protein involved in chromosome partitioning
MFPYTQERNTPMSDASTTCSEDRTDPHDQELAVQQRMSKIRRKLLVLSGKGGVGKSTVAVNLATSLARSGKKVGLLDVDLHGPSIPGLLGLSDARLSTSPHGSILPIQLAENLSVVSVGMMLDNPSDAVVWRGPMKYSMIQQFLKDIEWGALDVLIIDAPPGTGDEPLAVAQLVGANASAVIVTTPQDTAISDVRRSVSFCAMLDLHVAGIIENMSGLTCPHCQQQIDLFKTGGGKDLAEEMHVPFLGSIPIDPSIVTHGDNGRPFIVMTEDSPAATALSAMVEPILSEPNSHAPKPTTEAPTMRIAIPTADGKLCMHFGHCEAFAMIDVNPTAQTIVSTEYLTPPPHEPGVLPRWLHEQGATVIVAGGMGQRAQSLFGEQGIEVVVGAIVDKPERIVASYLNGTLETGENACDH